MVRFSLFIVLLVIAGCDGEVAPIQDALPDVAPHDVAVDMNRSDTLLPDMRPDGARPDVAPPDALLPDMHRPDMYRPDVALPDMRTPDAGCSLEMCNDQDDDCDGRVDEESACADAFVTQCQVILGLSRAAEHPDPLAQCPADAHCIDSGADALFHALPVDGPIAGDVHLLIGLRCPERPDFETTCHVALARSASDQVVLDPELCPLANDSRSPEAQCVRTDGTGHLHPLRLPPEHADANDHYAIAFACEDPNHSDRAAGLTRHIAVWLNTHYRQRNGEQCVGEDLFEASPVFGNCPSDPVDDEGRHRCASSDGDGAFHGFSFGQGAGDERVFEQCSAFGVALMTW